MNVIVGVRVGVGVMVGVRVRVGVPVNSGLRSIYHFSAMAVLVALTCCICCALMGTGKLKKPDIVTIQARPKNKITATTFRGVASCFKFKIAAFLSFSLDRDRKGGRDARFYKYCNVWGMPGIMPYFCIVTGAYRVPHNLLNLIFECQPIAQHPGVERTNPEKS